MILQLVSADGSLSRGLNRYLAPLGVSVVHYSDPLKAMDNLRETQPRIILYALQDFPRHWKIMIRFLREEDLDGRTVFLLFSSQKPDVEEADKALFLGAQALLTTSGTPEDLARQVKAVYSRYGVFENEGTPVWIWTPDEGPIPMVFRHPNKQVLVPGRLMRLHRDGAVFRPEHRQDILDLGPETLLKGCSLSIDGQTLLVDLKVTANRGQLSLEFLNLTPEASQTIEGKLPVLQLA